MEKNNLVEIRDLLKNEMEKFNAINNEVVENQHDFDKINKNYNIYNDKINKGRKNIDKLKKQEFYENLFVYVGFYFFFICVGIIFLRRFPLHKIIFFILNQIKKIIYFFFSKKKIKRFKNKIKINNLINIINNYFIT